MTAASAPAFSVLMCYYRGDDPHRLSEAFDSVTREQTLPPAQVVLVQDGPVPAPLAAAAATLIEDSTVPTTHVVLPVNSGLGVALNAGLARCEHDIVARMDADDISLPHRFERQLSVLEPAAGTGVDIVGSAMLEIGASRDDVVQRRVPPLEPARIVASSRFAQPFNHPTVVYRRSAVQRAGGYEDFKNMEDYLLFARMIQGGARVANVGEPLLLYRVGAGAYARRGGRAMVRTELALQRRFLAMGFTTPVQAVRNVAIRGVYRLIPEGVRRAGYGRLMTRRDR